jgi:hypothetical protein
MYDQEWEIGGANCGGKPVLVGGVRTNPGAPIELRLNVPLECTAPNSSALQGLVPTGFGTCYMGGDPSRQYYYYRTPNSPSSTPTSFAFEKLCLKYGTFTIPDRVMVISGRNRYKYGGWGVEVDCNGTMPLFWDDAGGTGIKQAELALSRSWPAENSVLDLPLFGADTSSNPATPPAPCSDGSCSDPSCFSIRANTGIGHYGASNLGNGNGYYSFQCFNPQCFYDQGLASSRPVPTCSVWSLLRAIWDQVRQLEANEATFRANQTAITSAFNNLFAADPSGTVSGKSNVRHHLEAFSTELLNLGFSFVIPNVFLWDKTAYNAASTNADKWKHIYIVGNANVIFDSQCTATAPGRNGFVIYLDEVSHDPTYGSSANARLISFFGCNSGYASNPNSEAYMEISTMNCVPAFNPKKGVYNTPCEDCMNEDLSYNTDTKCYHIGYSSNCDFNWSDFVNGSGGGGAGP